ncbi:TIGR00730 family Rossman fold protein [Aquihabitans daechungensis]|uniref:LOG family protein n=1 Tax=Aquihabitans daechungensis TaxID=1052257 RepID=UPI003BA1901A
MTRPLRTVAVFCGSNPGLRPEYAEVAEELGALLAQRGIGLVYGGGKVGLMGIVADAVLAGGGTVTGVIPRHLWEKEVGHEGLTELLIVDSMHERKLAMADRSDAFIALPGGVGTFEELFEAITWTQLGIHDKPVALLDVAGFYGPLLAFLDGTVDAGFLRPGHRSMIVDATTPEDVLAQLAAWEPVTTSKWLTPDER